jgi:hypothetical protein
VKVFFTQKFLRQYHAAPQIRQRQFDKQLAFLLPPCSFLGVAQAKIYKTE